jgi:D-alanine transaminase
MSRIAYVNGRYLPYREAEVHIDDRGYQFSDGVYEVVGLVNGRLFDEEPHWDRLNRSLKELSMPWPMSRAAFRLVVREVIRRNRVKNGIVYVQVNRGIAVRDHPFPKNAVPTLVITSRRSNPAAAAAQAKGVAVISVPDIRWKRCDIKTIGLLPNVLARQAAREAGAVEAWMVSPDGLVTEGAATNAWIVTEDNKLITRGTDTSILWGITRGSVAAVARKAGVKLVERPFSLAEAKKAREAFITSTTSFVTPVVKIDRTKIGGGKPGPLTRKLQDWYRTYLARQGAAA